MVGALIGDVVGSRFEFHNHLSKSFQFFHPECHFTDDSVMTLAVAESLMRSAENNFEDLSDEAVRTLHEIGRNYPGCGYGGRFFHWMLGDVWEPYESCGNGSAMRISAVGDIARDVDEAKELSDAVTRITHNHPEGMKGAEAAAVAKVLLKQGVSKKELRAFIEKNYYELPYTVRDYRNGSKGHGKEICQVSMPQAFVCFFEGDSFEDVIRNCVSIGGDSDTIAAIAGGIAEGYYKIPEWMSMEVRSYLPDDLKGIMDRWEKFRKLAYADKGGLQYA